MARRGGLTEQLVHDVSWLQHKLRLKEMEAEALLQQCHHLEAERDSLKAAYDLTRSCQAALLSGATGQSGCASRRASYYVPISCQTSRPQATGMHPAQPSTDWQNELLRGLSEEAVTDALGDQSSNLGDPPHACQIQ